MTLAKILPMPLPFPERLSEKLRPRTLDAFIGLERAKAILEDFIARPRSEAFFLCGPSGTGKTTMALAVCEAINGELHHIPSSDCNKERIEDTIRTCHRAPYNFFGPNAGKPCSLHVVLVDEADQMTGGAQLDLLSKLDVTAFPPTTVFFFTANGTRLLEPRFLSRCKVIEFGVPAGELPGYLAEVYKAEGGQHPLDFAKIAEESANNVRDALGKIEMELMIGAKRADLPASKAAADHQHKCGECDVAVPCSEKGCRKAAVTRTCACLGLPPEQTTLCAGRTTQGADRSTRGWETRKRKGA
jgi:replication-associated recombination protein RarA